MTITARIVSLLALLLPLWTSAQSAGPPPPKVAAGAVVMLTGQATAVGDDGGVRRLAKSDSVYSGDLINAGPGSYVNLRFTDGSFMLLKPNTRFGIEDYRQTADTSPAAPGPASSKVGAAAPLVTANAGVSSGGSRAFFRLFKGGFRAVSGAIGKINRDDYRVATPVATIGIRGTKYGGDLCEGDCADRNEIDTQLREAGTETDGTETILITTVEEGEISIETPQETQTQKPGEVRFVTPDGEITSVSEVPPSIQQDSVIQPEACGSGS